ncbi:hypothetical protein B0J11DRAFT_221983 [Dendryphion nanum]|uniref:Uncharacterized protein n=1 Tax=Dendryphion nanum TaxID=256645 RepID=A0A9P9IT15_9PLEO|nr:hypothetical protein B0J11DRAFT_221983 [Dendryphion nanum]
MVASRTLFAGLAAAACVSASALANEDAYFSALLKRQEPGTPAFNCHDNCGLAISLSRESSPCSNSRFLGSYANCIQCSGPDNYNIWRYYGFTLTPAGTSCGLETTPKSGKQPDVPPAGSSGPPGGVTGSSTGAGSSSAPPASSAPPSSTPRATSGTPPPATSGSQAPSTGAPAPSTGAPASSASTVGYPVSSSPSAHSVQSSAQSSTVKPVITSSPSISGVPHTSARNGTATFSATRSAPAQQSVNAAAGVEYNAVGFFGAMVMGVMYGM